MEASFRPFHAATPGQGGFLPASEVVKDLGEKGGDAVIVRIQLLAQLEVMRDTHGSGAMLRVPDWNR